MCARRARALGLGRMQVLTTARLPLSPQVRALELWGCGGADADKVLRELRSRRVRDASRAGKVDRGAMFGLGKGNDWRSEDNPDRMILETAGAHTFYSHQLEKLPDENH